MGELTMQPSAGFPISDRSLTVDKACRVLLYLGESSRPLGPRELARALHLNKSTVHRILLTLNAYGLVTQDSETGRYHLGVRLFELGTAAYKRMDIVKVARPFLLAVHEQTRETVQMALVDGAELVYVVGLPGLNTPAVYSGEGTRRAIYWSALGRVMLAWQPESRVRKLLPPTLPKWASNSVTDPESYIFELGAVRERGYSFRSHDPVEGFGGVAVPLFHPSGQVVGGLAIAGPADRVDYRRVGVWAEQLKGVSAEITSRLNDHRKLPRVPESRQT